MIKEDVLNKVNQLGKVYKKDLALYIRYISGDNYYANKVINKLVKDGLLVEKELDKKKGEELYRVISISKEGYKYLEKKIGEEKNRDALKEFQTTSPATLRARLNDARIKLMFNMAQVATAEEEKPTLTEMYYALSEKVDPATGKLYNRQKAQEFLDNGIYYTVKEMHDFIDNIGNGTSDTTYFSRVRGMYISTYTCLMVYIGQRGDNKIQRTTTQAETHLIKLLDPLLSLTKVYRILPELSKKKLSKINNKLTEDTIATNDVWGLMISDGDSLVYSMAMGNPRGLIKKKDFSEMFKDTDKEIRYKWLTSGTIYKRLFVTPFTVAGIGSLDYLCHTRAEQWQEDSRAFFQNHRLFKENEFNPLYPIEEVFAGKRRPTIYIPVFEVNELRAISEFDYEVTVLTYPDMVDAISHCARKKLRYYDADTLKLIPEDEIMLYDHSGYPLGQQIIHNKLQEMHISCDKREITKLPKKYEMPYTAFFNGIAKGEIDVEEVVSKLPVKPIKKEKKKYNTHKGVSLMLPSEMANRLKLAAKNRKLSVNRYVIQMLVDNQEYVDNDIKNKKRNKGDKDEGVSN